MRDLAFAFIWCALLPMSMMSAYVGILLWVWVAMLSPNDLLFGIMAGVPFNKLVAIVTIGLVIAKREKKDFYADGFIVAMLLLLCVATLSYLFAVSASGDGFEIYLKFVKEVVLAILITAVMGTRHRIFLVLSMIAFSMGFYGLTEGLQFVATAGGHKILGTPSVGDNNSLATAVLMVIPLISYLSSYSAMRFIRWGYLALMVICVLCVVGTFSRGGFLGMLVLGMFTVKNSQKKFRALMLVVIAAVIVVSVAPASWYERLSTINNAASEDTSFLGRVMAWKVSALIAMDRPFIGGGPHAVQQYVVWNTYRRDFAIFNWFPTPTPTNLPIAAHSIWFEILGDLGFTGLGLFIFILCLSLWNCSRISRLAKRNPSIAWAGDLARMIQTTLVIYATTGSALSMGYFEMYWIILAVTSRLGRTARQQLKEEALAAPSATAAYPTPGISGGRPAIPIPRPAVAAFAPDIRTRPQA